MGVKNHILFKMDPFKMDKLFNNPLQQLGLYFIDKLIKMF